MKANTVNEFKGWLIAALFALLTGIGGWAFSAQAAALAEVTKQQQQHGERLAKLEALAQSQRDINQELKEIVQRLSTR